MSTSSNIAVGVGNPLTHDGDTAVNRRAKYVADNKAQ